MASPTNGMPSRNLQDLRKLLSEASSEGSPAKRAVKIAAVLAEALREVGEDPVLVGGAAVEFYTEGGYTTQDIDMVAVGGPPLEGVMDTLGFTRRGKDFIHEYLEIYVEFPSESLNPGEDYDILDVGKLKLKIISIDDLIVDRLCAYKFWGSSIDGLAALLLLELGKENRGRLNGKARRREVEDALQAVRKIYEEAFRKKWSKRKSSQMLEKWLKK